MASSNERKDVKGKPTSKLSFVAAAQESFCPHPLSQGVLCDSTSQPKASVTMPSDQNFIALPTSQIVNVAQRISPHLVKRNAWSSRGGQEQPSHADSWMQLYSATSEAAGYAMPISPNSKPFLSNQRMMLAQSNAGHDISVEIPFNIALPHDTKHHTSSSQLEPAAVRPTSSQEGHSTRSDPGGREKTQIQHLGDEYPFFRGRKDDVISSSKANKSPPGSIGTLREQPQTSEPCNDRDPHVLPKHLDYAWLPAIKRTSVCSPVPPSWAAAALQSVAESTSLARPTKHPDKQRSDKTKRQPQRSSLMSDTSTKHPIAALIKQQNAESSSNKLRHDDEKVPQPASNLGSASKKAAITSPSKQQTQHVEETTEASYQMLTSSDPSSRKRTTGDKLLSSVSESRERERRSKRHARNKSPDALRGTPTQPVSPDRFNQDSTAYNSCSVWNNSNEISSTMQLLAMLQGAKQHRHDAKSPMEIPSQTTAPFSVQHGDDTTTQNHIDTVMREAQAALRKVANATRNQPPPTLKDKPTSHQSAAPLNAAGKKARTAPIPRQECDPHEPHGGIQPWSFLAPDDDSQRYFEYNTSMVNGAEHTGKATTEPAPQYPKSELPNAALLKHAIIAQGKVDDLNHRALTFVEQKAVEKGLQNTSGHEPHASSATGKLPFADDNDIATQIRDQIITCIPMHSPTDQLDLLMVELEVNKIQVAFRLVESNLQLANEQASLAAMLSQLRSRQQRQQQHLKQILSGDDNDNDDDGNFGNHWCNRNMKQVRVTALLDLLEKAGILLENGESNIISPLSIIAS